MPTNKVEEATLKIPIILRKEWKVSEVLDNKDWFINNIWIYTSDWKEYLSRYYTDWDRKILAFDIENHEIYKTTGSYEKAFFKTILEIEKWTNKYNLQMKNSKNLSKLIDNYLLSITNMDKNEELVYYNKIHKLIWNIINKSYLNDKNTIKKYYIRLVNFITKLQKLNFLSKDMLIGLNSINALIVFPVEKTTHIKHYNIEVNRILYCIDDYINNFEKSLNFIKNRIDNENNAIDRINSYSFMQERQLEKLIKAKYF